VEPCSVQLRHILFHFLGNFSKIFRQFFILDGFLIVFEMLRFLFPEPISGAAPRVALIQKTNIEYVRLGGIVSIMCPAQGFPVPAFR